MCLSRTVGYPMAGHLGRAVLSHTNTFSKQCVCVERRATPRPNPYLTMCVGLRLHNAMVLHPLTTTQSGGLSLYRGIVYQHSTVRVRHSKMLYCQSTVLCHDRKVPWTLEAVPCHTVWTICRILSRCWAMFRCSLAAPSHHGPSQYHYV